VVPGPALPENPETCPPPPRCLARRSPLPPKGLGFGVWGLGFGVWGGGGGGSALRVDGLGLRVEGAGLKVWGEGAGFEVEG
jgi:hypothetical protein